MAAKPRFYTDEGVANAVANGLRQRGADVMTAREAGMLGAPDPEHLARALEENRVLVTHDADYLRLHANGFRHAGIAYAPQTAPIGRIVRGLVLIHDVLEAQDMIQRVEFL